MAKPSSLTTADDSWRDERLKKIAIDIVREIYERIIRQQDTYITKLYEAASKQPVDVKWITSEITRRIHIKESMNFYRRNSAFYRDVLEYLEQRIKANELALPQST